MGTTDPWEMARQLNCKFSWVNGTDDLQHALQIIKLVEEIGEVAQALIGQQGQNPRKGFSHTREDVAKELCDVIITAMVALHNYAESGQRFFQQHCERITQRDLNGTAWDPRTE